MFPVFRPQFHPGCSRQSKQCHRAVWGHGLLGKVEESTAVLWAWLGSPSCPPLSSKHQMVRGPSGTRLLSVAQPGASQRGCIRACPAYPSLCPCSALNPLSSVARWGGGEDRMYLQPVSALCSLLSNSGTGWTRLTGETNKSVESKGLDCMLQM